MAEPCEVFIATRCALVEQCEFIPERAPVFEVRLDPINPAALWDVLDADSVASVAEIVSTVAPTRITLCLGADDDQEALPRALFAAIGARLQ